MFFSGCLAFLCFVDRLRIQGQGGPIVFGLLVLVSCSIRPLDPALSCVFVGQLAQFQSLVSSRGSPVVKTLVVYIYIYTYTHAGPRLHRFPCDYRLCVIHVKSQLLHFCVDFHEI